jgi:hypothetical protein
MLLTSSSLRTTFVAKVWMGSISIKPVAGAHCNSNVFVLCDSCTVRVIFLDHSRRKWTDNKQFCTSIYYIAGGIYLRTAHWTEFGDIICFILKDNEKRHARYLVVFH